LKNPAAKATGNAFAIAVQAMKAESSLKEVPLMAFCCLYMKKGDLL